MLVCNSERFLGISDNKNGKGVVNIFSVKAICDVAVFEEERKGQGGVPELRFRVKDHLLGLQIQQMLAVLVLVTLR